VHTAQPPDITVDGNMVEQIDNFEYHGSNQSSNGGSQSDMERLIALASSAVVSLYDECAVTDTCLCL